MFSTFYKQRTKKFKNLTLSLFILILDREKTINMAGLQKQKVHFIAIGGSVMHNLAISLKNAGFEVTGSDDEIYEPASSNLKAHNLLPNNIGWNEDRIHSELDAVILGMHARPDNPELKKALDLNLKIYSYPEYIYQQSKDKQRIVIAGSHGKTTITAMIIHVLQKLNKDFDFLVGAKVEGFETMVKLSDAPIIIVEGDEYYASALDKTPKFLKYHHHIGLISGISWDHVNVFPTYDEYVKQFDLFADATPKAGNLFYNEEDAMANVICSKERKDVNTMEYKIPEYVIKYGKTYLKDGDKEYLLQIFGRHNVQNIGAAQKVMSRIGVTNQEFFEAIQSFKGASNRLQLIVENQNTRVYKDFAHAPSKVEATTQAVKEQFPDRKLTVCLELHTFSSLNKKFLTQYQDTLNAADLSVVYFNPQTILHKKLEPLSSHDIQEAFNLDNLHVFSNKDDLSTFLFQQKWESNNLLLMSSGNFDGLEINTLAQKIVERL